MALTDTVTIERIASAVTAKMKLEYVCRQDGRIAVIEEKCSEIKSEAVERDKAIKEMATAVGANATAIAVVRSEKKWIVALIAALGGGAGGGGAVYSILKFLQMGGGQ